MKEKCLTLFVRHFLSLEIFQEAADLIVVADQEKLHPIGRAREHDAEEVARFQIPPPVVRWQR